MVLACCGHRGVVNSAKRAMEVSGIKKVHVVAGGFHLAPHNEDYMRETVAALKEINPDCIIPMHYSGETYIDIVIFADDSAFRTVLWHNSACLTSGHGQC